MQNISDQLADLAIARSLVLIRIQNGLSNDVAILYNEMIDDISTTILKTGKISNHLTKTIKDIKAQLQVPDINDNLKDIAQAEVNYTQKASTSVIGIDSFKNIPPKGAKREILNTSLIEGATIHSWLKDLEASQAFDVERAVRLGMTLGETNAQLANRLKSTMELSMRNAQTIVRTATATVANKARMEFMEANNEVIKGWEWNSTLDGRVRKEHADRDGATWNLDKEGINAKGKKYPFRYTPYGWNCRCQLNPILKSWKELGIDEEEVPVGTRSSLDGYVSQDMTFDKWLKTKSSEFQKEYLGAGRYELYSKGKITLSDLINQKGRYLSIKELKEKYS